MRRHSNGDDWKFCHGRAEARAYALAVMDAAVMATEQDTRPSSADTNWASALDALRREIEELG